MKWNKINIWYNINKNRISQTKSKKIKLIKYLFYFNIKENIIKWNKTT